MSKRDHVSEVVEVRTRRAELHRVVQQLEDLAHARTRSAAAALGGSALDFIPIRAVTLLEVFMRRWVAGLVNHGAPYAENAAKLASAGRVKLDFEAAVAIHGGRVSLGDLVAHGVSLNRIEDVLGTFSALLGEDFGMRLKNVHDRFAVERLGKPQEPIVGDFSAFRATFTRLFVVRHILVHETPIERPYTLQELEEFPEVASKFVRACQEIFTTALHGNYPLTTFDMIAEQGRLLKAAEDELAKVVDGVRGAVANPGLLEESHAAWLTYRHLQSALAGAELEGGSYQPIAVLATERRLTDQRIDELRWWLQRREGEGWRAAPDFPWRDEP